MISIVICSRNPDVSTELKQNIAETIGCEYELVVIDNSSNQYSIFQAYNEGVRRSMGEVLCFMHDDVLFRSSNWGGTIKTHFQENESVGVIGFAGTHFLPDMPMYWDESPLISEYNLTTKRGKTEKCFSVEHFGNHSIVEVVAVDGLCFFMRRILFEKVAFDEKTFSGFHLYDMDICMQAREAGYKVCVCNNVLVEHFYEFNPDKVGYDLFESNLQKFYDKWSSQLPLAVGLNGMTDGMIFQLNNYVIQKIRLEKSYKGVLCSKAYRIGKTLLNPLKKHKR